MSLKNWALCESISVSIIISEIVNYTLMMQNVRELNTSKLMIFNQARPV